MSDFAGFSEAALCGHAPIVQAMRQICAQTRAFIDADHEQDESHASTTSSCNLRTRPTRYFWISLSDDLPGRLPFPSSVVICYRRPLSLLGIYVHIDVPK